MQIVEVRTSRTSNKIEVVYKILESILKYKYYTQDNKILITHMMIDTS